MKISSAQTPPRGIGHTAFFWLGALLLACAAFWCWRSIDATHGMVRAEAVVAGYAHNGHGADRFVNIYRFVTASGKIVSVRGNLESIGPADDPGDKVAIYYDPDHTERGVIIDRFSERWFGVMIVAVLGVAFMAIGAIVRICSRAGSAQDAGNTGSKPTLSTRRATRTRQLLLVGGGAIALGLVGLGIAGLLFFHEYEITRGYARAVGTVADFAARESTGMRESRFQSAIVEFVSADGHKFEVAQGSASTGNSLATGDKVRVLYDPRNPQRAIIDDFWDRWVAASIPALIGLPFLAVGVFVCLTTLGSGRRGKRNSAKAKQTQTGN